MLVAVQLINRDGARQIVDNGLWVKQGIAGAMNEDHGSCDALGLIPRVVVVVVGVVVKFCKAAVAHDAGPVEDGLDGGGAVYVCVACGLLGAGEVGVG